MIIIDYTHIQIQCDFYWSLYKSLFNVFINIWYEM